MNIFFPVLSTFVGSAVGFIVPYSICEVLNIPASTGSSFFDGAKFERSIICLVTAGIGGTLGLVYADRILAVLM